MIVLYILIGLATFGFMEFVAWLNHKQLMHGALWMCNKDNHKRNSKKAKMTLNIAAKHFDKNDRFFIMYVTPAIILFIVGFSMNIPSLIALGIGITVFGITYFLMHDVILHERQPLPFLLKMDNSYIRAIRRGNLAHHQSKSKTDFHHYGLFIFSTSFFKA